jgi:Membrane-fusion protein
MNTKRKSKIKKRIITLISVIALIAIGAFVILSRPKINNYESVEAKSGDIKTYFSFSGNVEAKNRQNVMSEKVMQISDIKMKEGEKVKEGDVLFTTTTNDEITADIDGEVSKLNIEENEQVMAGISLLEIVDYNNLKVNVKLDEYSIPDLEVGKKATVLINAIDKEITGTVKSISKEGQVVNGVTYFTADIDLKKDKAIKVGMSAEIKFPGDSATDVATLPMSVIQFDESNNPFVYLKDEKDNLIKTAIKTGINDGTTVEVVSGIKKGDLVFYKKTTTSSNNSGFGPSNGGGE